MKQLALSVFLICYCFIIYAMNAHKHRLALLSVYAGAAVLLLGGALNLKDVVASLNFNVLGVFLGTMVLSRLFIYSQAPNYIASLFVNKSLSVSMAMLFVCALSGFISSFCDNVATVLIVGPVALSIAEAVKINPVPLLIGVSLSSNLQGTATMIGDAPSIILAMEAGMNFNDFFWFAGRPGIFFAVELGAVGAFFVLWLFFKKYRQRPPKVPVEKPRHWRLSLFLVLMVVSLVIFSFLKTRAQYGLALICLFWGFIGFLWYGSRHNNFSALAKDLDWHSLFFLAGIFILVGGLTHNGIVDDLAKAISQFSAGNPFFAYILIVFISVFVSAFVDNIPYTVAMIPVAKIVAFKLSMPVYPFLFGLLIGTCLGGNITPIGASCNIVTAGLLRKHGYKVRFNDFLRIGLPFTITAVTIGSMFIWFIWKI